MSSFLLNFLNCVPKPIPSLISLPRSPSSGSGGGITSRKDSEAGGTNSNETTLFPRCHGARPTKGNGPARKSVDHYAAEHPIDFIPCSFNDGLRVLVCRFCYKSIGARADRIKEHLASKSHQRMKLEASLQTSDSSPEQSSQNASSILTLPPNTVLEFPGNAGHLLKGEQQRRQVSHKLTNDHDQGMQNMSTPPSFGIIPSEMSTSDLPPSRRPGKPAPPRLCIRWGNYNSNIVSMFAKFQSAEHFVDVSLSCNGRTIKCHRVVLAACSAYFEQLLVENKSRHPIIILKNMKLWEIEALIDFMYKGETIIPQHKLRSLLRAAESLQIKGLFSSPPVQPNPRNDTSCYSLPTAEVQLASNSKVFQSPPFRTTTLIQNRRSALSATTLLGNSPAKRRKIETDKRIATPPHPRIVHAFEHHQHLQPTCNNLVVEGDRIHSGGAKESTDKTEPQKYHGVVVPGKKKKFIEKKNAVTFYLAHRSQKDPLIADETAPQRVLVPVNQAGGSDSAPVAGTSSSKPQKKQEIVKKKEEERKYGIYFDDEYDYLQHLRDSQEVSNVDWDFCERIPAPDINPEMGVSKKSEMKDFKLKLPSSVFESEYVEEIGLLNKAAPSYGPRPDLDPDIVAGLEDDFDYENPENELEDNFMELAGCAGEGVIPKEDLEGLFSDEEEDGGDDDEEMDEDESDDDTIGSLEGAQYNPSEDGDGNRSHFTSYSMSSSVLKRNEQLTLLDDRFERMFAEYEGTEIGALDCDEIEGHLDPQSDLLMQYADQYETDKAKEDILNKKILEMAVRDEESSDTVESSSDDENDEGKKWDCESILSTYTNTKNRPNLIKEPSKRNVIKISGKTGMPVGVLGSGLTAGNLKELNNQYVTEGTEIGPRVDGKSVGSMASSIWLPRSKVETPEERVERKLRVKEYKKERRLERKANTEAFKEEKKRQVKVRLNCKANVSGLKL